MVIQAAPQNTLAQHADRRTANSDRRYRFDHCTKSPFDVISRLVSPIRRSLQFATLTGDHLTKLPIALVVSGHRLLERRR